MFSASLRCKAETDVPETTEVVIAPHYSSDGTHLISPSFLFRCLGTLVQLDKSKLLPSCVPTQYMVSLLTARQPEFTPRVNSHVLRIPNPNSKLFSLVLFQLDLAPPAGS